MFNEIFWAALWLLLGLKTVFAPRKDADPRGQKLVRVFGWGEVAVSLLFFITAIALHGGDDRVAMIVFYTLMSLSILCIGFYGFIYQSVTGDKRAGPLCWALLLFCALLSAFLFVSNVVPRLK